MKLMQNSGVPIYQQIADSFKTDILAGRYEQGRSEEHTSDSSHRT